MSTATVANGVCMILYRVRFSFFSTKQRYCFGRTSPKWSVLFRIGCKTLLAVTHFCILGVGWLDCKARGRRFKSCHGTAKN